MYIYIYIPSRPQRDTKHKRMIYGFCDGLIRTQRFHYSTIFKYQSLVTRGIRVDVLYALFPLVQTMWTSLRFSARGESSRFGHNECDKNSWNRAQTHAYVPCSISNYLIHGADIFTQRAVTFVTVDGMEKREKGRGK